MISSYKSIRDAHYSEKKRGAIMNLSLGTLFIIIGIVIGPSGESTRVILAAMAVSIVGGIMVGVGFSLVSVRKSLTEKILDRLVEDETSRGSA
jgi:hypothetical protein